MAKIVFIGGGSTKFVRELAIDLLMYDELKSSEIVLMDIIEERVRKSHQLVEKIIAEMDVPATVSWTTDQREAVAGADYVIVTIMVGGFECYRADVAIPESYGVLQTVSDTIGPGGVFRLVRTAPVLAELHDNLAELAPEAWILNYANPMAMNCMALSEMGNTRTVGLCHSIQGCVTHHVARWLDIPADEIRYTAAGINHINFYLELEHQGQDLHPRLLEVADEVCAKSPAERMRFELLEKLGHFPAEGPNHQGEYYPWFSKDKETAEHYGAVTYWGYHNDFGKLKTRGAEIDAQISGEKPITYHRSLEYGASIIHAMETGEAFVFYGNMPNRGLIDNLPSTAIVEVPCVADRSGIFPCRMGAIPEQLAAVMTPHIHVHRLAVEAARQQNKTTVRQAIQADPLTAAVLTLPQITDMVDEMCAFNDGYLGGWSA